MEVMMAFRMNPNDYRILESIADYRILTPTQIAALYQKSRQVVWRRLRVLENEGFIQTVKCELGQSRGRPESLLGLTEKGLDILKEQGVICGDTPYERVNAALIQCPNHQLLLNWFRIHLSQVEKVLPQISVRVMVHNSPFLPKAPNGGPLITDLSAVPGTGEKGVRFTPDAVFGTSDSCASKTCLFFLEVDCSTETMASPRRYVTDIRQKIINYQGYFRSLKYKRYEEVLKCKLKGFRLLILTNNLSRLAALCRLIQEIRPSDFVWLTEYNRLVSKGVSGRIWAKGGNLHGAQQSILGSLCCQ
jgi:DNA-binding Lrp family transcriptional regulator